MRQAADSTVLVPLTAARQLAPRHAAGIQNEVIGNSAAHIGQFAAG
jgi:hypothetical protein